MFAFFKKAAIKKTNWAYSSEIKAIGFLAIALFLAISLLTHSATDHSWFYYDTRNTTITNWCGYTGSCIAAVLFYLFGCASIILVGMLFFLFYCLMYKKTFRQEWDRLTAYIVLLFIASAVCCVHNITYFSSSVPGGYCGYVTHLVLNRWFDKIGTLIVLYTMLIIMTILITRLSFVVIIHTLFKKISYTRFYYFPTNMIGFKIGNMYASINVAFDRINGWFKEKLIQSYSSGDTEHCKPELDVFWKNFLNSSKKSKALIAQKHEIKNVINKHSDVPKIESVLVEQNSAVALENQYQLPQLDMFIGVNEEQNDQLLIQELEKRAGILQEKLERFGVFGKVSAIKRGPVVTMFEYQPHIDTKISKIIALEDDLALALQATSIRIIAPIPGKSLVGFEVANRTRRNVLLSTLIKSDIYQETKAILPMILGVDTIGSTVVIDLATMPHLLMAGSTGSGKSVSLNAMLISLLCKTTPDDLRLIIIDPKRLEFAPYADIAHLLFPIVTDPKRAPSVLRWVVKQMEQRYEIMAQAGARNIYDYRMASQSNNYENMPYIVVIIDELADLMMTAGKEVEDAIIRITQMARAAGIHLISATQRPSVDVITGLIKVNFPSRISFRVTSKIDSRTILDCSGADKLLGRGDMLFLDANDSLLKRIHGAYVLDKEINQVIAHIKSQRPSDYLDLKQICDEDRVSTDYEQDMMYEQICQFIQEIDEVSISLLQRRFRIGYNRSARIIDMLESQGLISPSYGGKTRKVVKDR